MALSQKLLIRQSQALVMTPQLMQAIKLLQLSNLDLTAYVENELERNPLLERSSEGDEARGDETPSAPDGAAAGETSGEAQSGDWMGEELETSRSSMESNLDTGLENVFPDDTAAPAERLHVEGPAAYSCLADVPDGTIVCLYERGTRHASEKITLARFSLAWLTDNKEEEKK